MRDGLEMPRRPQQQQQQQSQVNVQTSSQPVLVVPLNMAQQPAPPAEYMGTATPGAPPTFAVDTSERAMSSAGLPSVQANRRPASRSPGRNSSQGTSSQVNSNTAANTRVNVIKEG